MALSKDEYDTLRRVISSNDFLLLLAFEESGGPLSDERVHELSGIRSAYQPSEFSFTLRRLKQFSLIEPRGSREHAIAARGRDFIDRARVGRPPDYKQQQEDFSARKGKASPQRVQELLASSLSLVVGAVAGLAALAFFMYATLQPNAVPCSNRGFAVAVFALASGLAACPPPPPEPPSITITGYIYYANSSKPVRGAVVVHRANNLRSGPTGDDGFFTLSLIPPGTRKFIVAFGGNDYSLECPGSDDKVAAVMIGLDKASGRMLCHCAP